MRARPALPVRWGALLREVEAAGAPDPVADPVPDAVPEDAAATPGPSLTTASPSAFWWSDERKRGVVTGVGRYVQEAGFRPEQGRPCGMPHRFLRRWLGR